LNLSELRCLENGVAYWWGGAGWSGKGGDNGVDAVIEKEKKRNLSKGFSVFHNESMLNCSIAVFLTRKRKHPKPSRMLKLQHECTTHKKREQKRTALS